MSATEFRGPTRRATRLVAAAICEPPSRSYTLAELGRGFSEYLFETRPPTHSPADEPDFADFLIDLARLERCYSEVFDLPGPEREPGLTPEIITSIAPVQFAGTRLIFHDTVRLLTQLPVMTMRVLRQRQRLLFHCHR
jgi:hypothetical protein